MKIRFIPAKFALILIPFFSASLFAQNADVVKDKYSSPYDGEQTEWETLNCHDPKIFQDDDGTYYVYSTDASIGDKGIKGLQIRKSDDLANWQCLGKSAIDGNWDNDFLNWLGFDESDASTWAPTVIKRNGLYYMFHGIIRERNDRNTTGAIALAVASSAEGPFYPAHEAARKDAAIAHKFKELGIKYTQSILVRYCYNPVSGPSRIEKIPSFNNAAYDTRQRIASDASSWDGGFGTIDPEFVIDVATGKPAEYEVAGKKVLALTYGSWKGGIALLYLDPLTLKPVDEKGKVISVPCDAKKNSFGKKIAGGSGAAYEGAQVIYSSETGYHYLFVSMGKLDYDYRVGVGRSEKIEGPYTDAGGREMEFNALNSGDFHEYGSKIIGAHALENEYPLRAQGGQSILRTADGKILFANHTRTNWYPGYFFFLQVHQMFFTKSGWPVLNQNEFYPGDGEKKLGNSEIAGTYQAVLTERGTEEGPVRFAGMDFSVTANESDAYAPETKNVVLKKDETVAGDISGKWTSLEDGTFELELDDLGKFTGKILNGTNWALDSDEAERSTMTFCTISETSGEYLWGTMVPKK